MDIKQIRRQALNEKTLPNTLVELAESKDLLTRKYVASNSNATAEILNKLAREFPTEVMANPILDLLSLSNPDEFVQLKRKVASSISTPKSILERFKDDSDRYVREYVAKNSNTSKMILNRTYALTKNQDYGD